MNRLERMNHTENKIIRPQVIAILVENDWHVEIVHGGMFQQGFPDLYCMHKKHGKRWIELKVPGRKLRHSQFRKFKKWQEFGTDIWVVDNPKTLMEVIFGPPNWIFFF